MQDKRRIPHFIYCFAFLGMKKNKNNNQNKTKHLQTLTAKVRSLGSQSQRVKGKKNYIPKSKHKNVQINVCCISKYIYRCALEQPWHVSERKFNRKDTNSINLCMFCQMMCLIWKVYQLNEKAYNLFFFLGFFVYMCMCVCVGVGISFGGENECLSI